MVDLRMTVCRRCAPLDVRLLPLAQAALEVERWKRYMEAVDMDKWRELPAELSAARAELTARAALLCGPELPLR